jgi:hypothetical protein
MQYFGKRRKQNNLSGCWIFYVLVLVYASITNARTDFRWKLLRMLPFVKPRIKLQNNYKIGLKEIGCENWR